MAKSSSASSVISSAASAASTKASTGASSAAGPISSAAAAASVKASEGASAASDSISSVASAASNTASTGASSVSGSVSSAASSDPASIFSTSDGASPSLSSAASAATARASKIASDAEQGLPNLLKFNITIPALVTLLAVIAVGIYFSGYADDLGRWVAKKYYRGKAQAEAEALGKVGGERAEGFLKDSLKHNPVMGEDELEQFAPGLGNEAAQEGLGNVTGRYGELKRM